MSRLPNFPVAGGCACGAIRYRLSGAIGDLFLSLHRLPDPDRFGVQSGHVGAAQGFRVD